jgi:hypothetical protein
MGDLNFQIQFRERGRQKNKDKAIGGLEKTKAPIIIH